MNEQTVEIIPMSKYGQCATGCTTKIYEPLTPSIAKRLAGGGWHNVTGIDRNGALVTYKVRWANVYKVTLISAENMRIAQENEEEEAREQQEALERAIAQGEEEIEAQVRAQYEAKDRAYEAMDRAAAEEYARAFGE